MPPAPQPRPNGGGVAMPPIPREKFFQLLSESYKRQGVTPDERMLNVNGRNVDLKQLHTEMLHFGSVANVSRHQDFLSFLS